MTQRGIGSMQPLEETLEEARRGERTRIARQLHAGILQELTVAGFQLKALHDQVPKGSRPAVDDLASWLEMRQRELRQFVAELEGGNRFRGDLGAIIDDAKTGFGCEVTLVVQPEGAKLNPMFRLAVRTIAAELVQTIAVQLGGRHITAILSLETLPKLNVSHDGASVRTMHLDLDHLRRFIGTNGASIRIDETANGDNFVVDWDG